MRASTRVVPNSRTARSSSAVTRSAARQDGGSGFVGVSMLRAAPSGTRTKGPEVFDSDDVLDVRAFAPEVDPGIGGVFIDFAQLIRSEGEVVERCEIFL